MSRVHGAALSGVEGACVEVEVRLSSQLPKVDIVGLPEAAVRESTARVRGAIAAVGERFPDRRVTVNLAPASLRKSGAGLDLPISIGVLAAAGALEASALEGRGFIGELALDSRLRPVRGALALVLATRDAGCREVFVPEANASEAALAPDVRVFASSDLAGVLAHLREAELLALREAPEFPSEARHVACISEVRGQEGAKRSLEIAAAGGHGVLFSGPPGAGKTMLASRLPGLLPPLRFDEALEVTQIYGAGNLLDAGCPIMSRRPFRAPHHTASTAGLLGGGNPPRPGEVSLAHRGVLFLDELPEFNRRSLESLRQVLEEKRVRIARAAISCSFPAHFQLVAAANPCPCGWWRSDQRDCRCDDGVLARYRARLSGPLLDRIDLHVRVPAVRWRDLDLPATGPTSAEIRARIDAARQLQQARGVPCNAEIPDARLDELVASTPETRELLGRAVDRLRLSARAARRTLRTARTIADLAGSSSLTPASVAEAISHRGENAELDDGNADR